MKNLLVVFFVSVVAAVYATPYVVTWEGSEEETSSINTNHLFGKKKCTFGPSYWCHNITHAAECHAVPHCIKNVWEEKKYPKDKDSVCQICIDMVGQARAQLLSNQTQDEIRQVLEGSCNLIPVKEIAKECGKMADELTLELIDLLASRMDPETVCSVSGLCNSIRIDEMLGEMKNNEITNNENQVKKFDLMTDSCPKCNYFIGKAVKIIKDLPQEQLLVKLLKICGHLGSYSDGCRAEVMNNFEQIVHHVENDLDENELCGLVGLCHVQTLHRVALGTKKVVKWTPPVGDDDVGCDFCKQMVSYLQNWLMSNVTKDEFKTIAKGLCKQTGTFRKECLSLVDQYGKVLYQLLIDEMDPVQNCAMIGICNSPGKNLFSEAPIWMLFPANKPRIQLPMVQLVPGEKLTGNDEKESLKPKSQAVCEFCEYALHQIQNTLNDPATEYTIKEAVDKLCDKILPKEMASQCESFVKAYGDSVIQMLEHEIDPSTVCPALHVCPEESKIFTNGGIALKNPGSGSYNGNLKSKVEDLPTCPLCHFAVSKLIDMLGVNRSKAAIDSAMDRVCYVLPKTTLNRCLSFMKNYGERVAEMIVIEFTAREVCMALHLCVLHDEKYQQPQIVIPEVNNLNKEIIIDEKLKDSTCQICKLVMIQLDNMLKNKDSEEEIKNAVESVCNLFPNKYSMKCDELIETYGDMIIQFLVSEMDPEQICEELKLCQPPKVEEPKPRSVEEKPTCVICEYAMSKLDEMISENATETEIKETVEKVCTYLPKTVRSSCRSFIDTYADQIIQFLVNDLSPEEVCTQLGLCGGKKAPVIDEKLNMTECQMCIMVSDYLETMLEDEKVVKDVDAIVERICPLFPSKYRTKCKIMIEDYGPYLMSLLAQEVDKGEACEMLQICHQSVKPRQ